MQDEKLINLSIIIMFVVAIPMLLRFSPTKLRIVVYTFGVATI